MGACCHSRYGDGGICPNRVAGSAIDREADSTGTWSRAAGAGGDFYPSGRGLAAQGECHRDRTPGGDCHVSRIGSADRTVLRHSQV